MRVGGGTGTSCLLGLALAQVRRLLVVAAAVVPSRQQGRGLAAALLPLSLLAHSETHRLLPIELIVEAEVVAQHHPVFRRRLHLQSHASLRQDLNREVKLASRSVLLLAPHEGLPSVHCMWFPPQQLGQRQLHVPKGLVPKDCLLVEHLKDQHVLRGIREQLEGELLVPMGVLAILDDGRLLGLAVYAGRTVGARLLEEVLPLQAGRLQH
mmetsp:Transcript_12763/g.50968  ORF Transcript_12763/g.50968 Transcript_12763/m.50968 type:complete len:210 (-) Transcript_12763:96-725(-)